MSNGKIDMDKLQEQTEFLLKLLKDKDNRGGFAWNDVFHHHIRMILELVLSDEEVQALKLLSQNKDLLEFVTKNHDILKGTRKIRGVLRVPETIPR